MAPGSFYRAQDIRVLHPGSIEEVLSPVSGVIAAKRIGRIKLDGGLPEDLVILAEEVGQGAEHARLLPAGGLPSPGDDPKAALQALEELARSFT